MKRIIKASISIIMTVLLVFSICHIPALAAAKKKSGSKKNTIDATKYLVRDNKTLKGKAEHGFDSSTDNNIYVDFYCINDELDESYKPAEYAYEFTKRPSYAGKVKTVTLSDNDLLPENLLKLNLQVGDIVITESFTYEQDGDLDNGKEPIEWTIQKVQYLYTIYPYKSSPATRTFRMRGANFSACYYMTSNKVLDYDEYFLFEDYTQLYSGNALNEQPTKYAKRKFVNDPLHGTDIDFALDRAWNVKDTFVYTGIMSIYKFADKDSIKVEPTEYAKSKGLPLTKGYSTYNWLFGTSPYYTENGIDISFKGLSVKYNGKLKWNLPYCDKSGYRPEMTLWTGIDTAETHENYDLSKEEFSNGTWRKKYEINYDIWKDYEPFVVWKWK